MVRERMLDAWLKTPGFRVTKATREETSVTFTVNYENNIADTTETYECPFSGTIYCDHRNDYRIVKTDFIVTFRSSGSPARQRRLITQCEYDNSEDRYAVPQRVTIAVENDAGVMEPHSTWYTSDIEVVNSVDERFTLSHYGLPEPYGVEWERPTSWRSHAGILAGVLLVLLFLLVLRKRRLLF